MKTKLIACLVAALAIGALLLVPSACTHPNATKRTLEAAGYSRIEITGWRPFSRGDDWYATGFRAVGPRGHEVTGTVTGGLIFKGNTICTD